MKIILEDEQKIPKEAEEKFFNYGKEKVQFIDDISEESKGKWIQFTSEELHEQFNCK